MIATPVILVVSALVTLGAAPQGNVTNDSPLGVKAEYLLEDLLAKHSLDGLYVSMVASKPEEGALHTVDGLGNVIHAGVWTGRYLAGVGYQYAVTEDPEVRRHGGEILEALRVLQEVTGKAGLLARGYVKGHGPVNGWERDGADSAEWHQGQGDFADYRWYGDVSVDNFNAVLYGYAVYFDLAADEEQKRFIAHDVDRLMTHLLDNHCRIVDVDGEVTQYGHVGVDPSPDRAEYYKEVYGRRYRRYGVTDFDALPLRASLMLLPDLLIAHRITGDDRYRDFYNRVVERFGDNPSSNRYRRDMTDEQKARMGHSPAGQAYEALYNLIRYERDPRLAATYRGWVGDMWERYWNEGNSLFTFMTLALLPEHRPSQSPGRSAAEIGQVPHGEEGLELALDTLRRFPVDRVLRPVMNSRRSDLELIPSTVGTDRPLPLHPLPIDERPHDNEYEWKGNPHRLDGWLKPSITAIEFACDDAHVGWLCDTRGRLLRSRDGGRTWEDVTGGTMGAAIRNIVASPTRTYVLWADTNRGRLITRDGGMSWRAWDGEGAPDFPERDFSRWQQIDAGEQIRIDESQRLVVSRDEGATAVPDMQGWRIDLATYCFVTPWGVIAGGPGGVYRQHDDGSWQEITIWPEQETGAADYLHAYWMGRYYGFVPPDAAKD